MRKYRVWLLIIILSIVIIFMAWFFQLLPGYVLRFSLAPLVGIFLTVLLVWRKRYKLQLVELLKKLIEFERRGGLLYKYGRALNAIAIIAVFAVSTILYYNRELLSIEYMPYVVCILFLAVVISGVAFFGGILRMAGKWGLLLITIIAIPVILRFLLLR